MTVQRLRGAVLPREGSLKEQSIAIRVAAAIRLCGSPQRKCLFPASNRCRMALAWRRGVPLNAAGKIVINLSRSHPSIPEASSGSDVLPSAQAADIESMLRLQRIRRANLVCLMEELGPEGLEPRIRKSKLLGLSREALQRAIGGGGLAQDEAREVEWAMNRPRGWLDADHRGEPD